MARPVAGGGLVRILLSSLGITPLIRPASPAGRPVSSTDSACAVLSEKRPTGREASMDLMQRCASWMMSLGWLGMALGVVLLAAVVVLLVLLLTRGRRGAGR